jgi:hypothetical protein
MKISPEWRFLLKTERQAPEPGQKIGCLLWTAGLSKDGYGIFFAEGKVVSSHNWSYEHWVGPRRPGFEVDHTCHNRSQCFAGKDCAHRRCVEPSHLELVTKAENTRRAGGRKPRKVRELKPRKMPDKRANSHTFQTHCKNGHEFTLENTYINPTDGARVCRTCRSAWARKKKLDREILAGKLRSTNRLDIS